jgi:hypothetical protein
MFVNSEIPSLPCPRLSRPLVVDTVAWSGTSLRRTVGKLQRRGIAEVSVLVMFARAEPFPAVEGLLFLELARGIPRFWYDEPMPDPRSTDGR